MNRDQLLQSINDCANELLVYVPTQCFEQACVWYQSILSATEKLSNIYKDNDEALNAIFNAVKRVK